MTALKQVIDCVCPVHVPKHSKQKQTMQNIYFANLLVIAKKVLYDSPIAATTEKSSAVQQQLTNRGVSMETAKTIREAVTLAVEADSDHWSIELGQGVLHDAVVRNRIIGRRGENLADARVMDMATKYGRHWQVIGG